MFYGSCVSCLMNKCNYTPTTTLYWRGCTLLIPFFLVDSVFICAVVGQVCPCCPWEGSWAGGCVLCSFERNGSWTCQRRPIISTWGTTSCNGQCVCASNAAAPIVCCPPSALSRSHSSHTSEGSLAAAWANEEEFLLERAVAKSSSSAAADLVFVAFWVWVCTSADWSPIDRCQHR